MINVVKAIEIEPVGVFHNRTLAMQFNKSEGDTLQLYPIRTTLTHGSFLKAFFSKSEYGHYLEQCCGQGSVQLNIKKPLFHALHCISGPQNQKDELAKLFAFHEENEDKWEKDYYKSSMLLSVDEVTELATHPFRVVFVKGFGEVNEESLSEFKEKIFNQLVSCVS